MIQTATQSRSSLPQKDGCYVVPAAYEALPELRAASTTREFQQNLPDNATRTQEIEAACDRLGLSNCSIFHGEQKHTNNVATVAQELTSSQRFHLFPATDALVSAKPGTALVVQTADCAPIFLYDPEARVMGLAHAGWRGTLSRIVQRTVAEMQALGAAPHRLVSWIGPMAERCCYEVSPELIEQFQRGFADYPAEQIHTDRYLDLVAVNRLQLLELGLSESNVTTSGICTIHGRDRFFSYRGDGGTTGRILSILALTAS